MHLNSCKFIILICLECTAYIAWNDKKSATRPNITRSELLTIRRKTNSIEFRSVDPRSLRPLIFKTFSRVTNAHREYLSQKCPFFKYHDKLGQECSNRHLCPLLAAGFLNYLFVSFCHQWRIKYKA